MRSLISKLAEFYLRLTRVNENNYQKEIDELIKKGEQDWLMPKSIAKDIEESSFNGMKVYYVNKNTNYKKVLFYIHGGYYLHQPLSFHVKMLKRIIKGSDTMLVFPIYPLAPFNTVNDSFENMVNLFNKVQETNRDKKIILSGDSAGGGYSLALAEAVTKQPDELILLSPWVDITMSNPDINNYRKADPMLCVNKAIYAGDAWKGQYDNRDYHVSPLFGDLSKLGKVTIFVGTREMLYPDIMLLYNKVKSNNDNVSLIVGDKQNHVYPAFPTREGHQAVKQIIDIINR